MVLGSIHQIPMIDLWLFEYICLSQYSLHHHHGTHSRSNSQLPGGPRGPCGSLLQWYCDRSTSILCTSRQELSDACHEGQDNRERLLLSLRKSSSTEVTSLLRHFSPPLLPVLSLTFLSARPPIQSGNLVFV
jgi:hypothetical protein